MFELLVSINYHNIILVIFSWYRIEYSRSYFHLEGSQGERIRVFKISRCLTQVTSYFGYFLSQSLLMLSFVSPTKSDLSEEMKSWKKNHTTSMLSFMQLPPTKSLASLCYKCTRTHTDFQFFSGSGTHPWYHAGEVSQLLHSFTTWLLWLPTSSAKPILYQLENLKGYTFWEQG